MILPSDEAILHLCEDPWTYIHNEKTLDYDIFTACQLGFEGIKDNCDFMVKVYTDMDAEQLKKFQLDWKIREHIHESTLPNSITPQVFKKIVCQDPRTLLATGYIVMEKMDATLLQWIEAQTSLSVEQLKGILAQMVRLVLLLHSKCKLKHRNIGLDTIYVKGDLHQQMNYIPGGVNPLIISTPKLYIGDVSYCSEVKHYPVKQRKLNLMDKEKFFDVVQPEVLLLLEKDLIFGFQSPFYDLQSNYLLKQDDDGWKSTILSHWEWMFSDQEGFIRGLKKNIDESIDAYETQLKKVFETITATKDETTIQKQLKEIKHTMSEFKLKVKTDAVDTMSRYKKMMLNDHINRDPVLRITATSHTVIKKDALIDEYEDTMTDTQLHELYTDEQIEKKKQRSRDRLLTGRL